MLPPSKPILYSLVLSLSLSSALRAETIKTTGTTKTTKATKTSETSETTKTPKATTPSATTKSTDATTKTTKSATVKPGASSASQRSKTRKAGPVKSNAEAVAIVNADPEVKKFVALIKQSGMKGSDSFVEFDRMEDGDYIIHVYQYVPDDAESGHTATFNWYHVNSKTGKLSKEF